MLNLKYPSISVWRSVPGRSCSEGDRFSGIISTSTEVFWGKGFTEAKIFLEFSLLDSGICPYSEYLGSQTWFYLFFLLKASSLSDGGAILVRWYSRRVGVSFKAAVMILLN